MEKIEKWIRKTTKAVENTLGKYPFDIHVYIHKRENASEPVPWSHTRRDEHQSVNFYISPDYSLKDFLDDWTAPHEISHLSIPYVGKDNAWFAEGYASFMQYQVMVELGIYTNKEIQEKYEDKIKSVKPFYSKSNSLVSVAQNLRGEYKFPQMYWGSATFFMRLDQILNARGTSLVDIVKEYQKCCRLKDSSIDDVIKSWDKIIGAPEASELFESYHSLPAYEMINVHED